VQGGEEGETVVALRIQLTLFRSWMYHCCLYFRTGKYNETYRLPQPLQSKVLAISATSSLYEDKFQKRRMLDSLL
jgi:hypothetical protein